MNTRTFQEGCSRENLKGENDRNKETLFTLGAHFLFFIFTFFFSFFNIILPSQHHDLSYEDELLSVISQTDANEWPEFVDISWWEIIKMITIDVSAFWDEVEVENDETENKERE